MNQALALSSMFGIVGQIIMVIALIGGGMVLYVSYVFWCAARFGRSFYTYLFMAMLPAILIIVGCIALSDAKVMW